MFVHKDTSAEQKAHLVNCVEKAVTSNLWIDTLNSLKVTPLNISGAEKDRLMNQYVSYMKKYGL